VVPSTLVEDVDRVCRDVIEPAALDVDADVVPRSHLDALAPTGLFGQAMLDGADAADVRRAHERLAGACLSTWFVVAQHQSPVALVRDSSEPLRSAVLPMLASGTSVAGIAFSHLRRWPQRPVEIERVRAGWKLRGTAPWYTGWGINDVAVVAGASAAGEVVFVLVPAEAAPSVRPGEPLDTMAMSAARTVPLVLDDLVVPDDGVLSVLPIEQWTQDDRAKAANVSPAVLGVTAATLDRLAGLEHDASRSTAAVLTEALDAVRVGAYDLIDHTAPHEQLDLRVQLRAQALRLCVDAAAALVAARGGRAMLRTDDAQMLARWASFLTVQAQTADLRNALLAGVTERWRVR
jgi:alkylation response protein AidB-like acyl-CoA dehydrogenase